MKIHQILAAAALMAVPTMGVGAILPADTADAVVQGRRHVEPSDGDEGTGVATASGFTLKVGSIGGGAADDEVSGRAAVFVFQLPDLGLSANPFSTASLTFHTAGEDASSTTLNVNGDLYGLGRRAAADVLQTDYYLGDLDSTDATVIQDNILVPGASANVQVDTNAGGNAALAAYLNAQYASGAGVGEYVFLRLSPDATSEAATGYNVYTANAGTSTDPNVADNVPFITYTAVPEPASLSLIGLAGMALARRRRS